MESLCLWVVTAPPNYSPLPWVVSLFQQVWNIALEPIIPQPTLDLAWGIVQFLRSAPVQTGKRTRAPVFTMCSLRAGNTDLLSSISGMFIALLSRQPGWGHSLCRMRAQSHQRPPSPCGSIILLEPSWAGQERFPGTAWGTGEDFFFFQRGDVNNCKAPTAPSPKKNEFQVTSQIYSQIHSTATLCQVLVEQSSAVQLRPWVNPSLPKACPFFTHLHFLPSSNVLCYFSFGTFWGLSFSLQNRDGDLGSWVETFSLLINSSHLYPHRMKPHPPWWCFYSH